MTSAQLLALLPILILALGATLVLMIGAWWQARTPLMILGMAIAVSAGLAAWLFTPPLQEVAGMFGTGPYARFFTAFWALLSTMILLLSSRYGQERNFPPGEYTCLVLFAAAGMALLSSATSLVGVLLGLESFTLVLYILIAIDKQSMRGAEAGLKYLVMGLVATGFLAFGLALVYASCGTLHLPEALQQVGAGGPELRPVGLLGWGMLLCALGFKVSLVPFHLWTPDVYQGAPAPVAALLSTGSKGAVFAVLLTLLSGLPASGHFLTPVLWTLAAASMLIGTLCALGQDNLKRMLAYSSVVHMGYLLIGVLAGGANGRSAVIFYIVAYTVATLGAFAILTSFSLQGEEPQDYRNLRGLGYQHPRRSAALAFFLLSLAGIPPTGGFLAKFGLFRAALEANYVVLTLVGIVASLISLYYYLRPIIVMFMGKEREVCLHVGSNKEFAVQIFCLAATLVLGLYPAPLLALILSILG